MNISTQPRASIRSDVDVFPVFNREALAILKARDLPRVRASDYFGKTGEAQTAEEEAATDDEMARWDAYLAGFAKLTDGQCLCCGMHLSCYLGMRIFGGFAWGMAHGEGHCTYCRYPMRGHHLVKDLGTIRNLFLPYHPSELSFPIQEVP